MAYSSYQNSDNIVPYFVSFVADEISDIDNLPTEYAPGSTCIVLENSSLYVLGNDEKWHEVS